MKKLFKRTSAVLMVVMLLVTLVVPMTAFAATTVSATQAHVFFSTSSTIPTGGVKLALKDENGNEKLITMFDQGGHWSVPDDSTDVGAALLGVYVTFEGYGTVFYSHYYTTPEGSNGSGTINIRLGTINPPTQYTLTIHYVLDSDSSTLHADSTYTRDEGTTESFDALDLTGYDLKNPSDSPYSYTFNASGEYTFRYVAEPTEPEQYTLTIHYVLDSDSSTLHADSTYTRDEGTTESFDALDLTGYDLKTPSDSPYSYTFNASGEYTFRYVAEPTEPEQYTLTIYYVLDSDSSTLHADSTYTRDEGTTESFDALDLTGYDLKTPSDSPYSYTFNASGEYTFRYVAEPPTQYTLTIHYVLDSDSSTLHADSTYTRDEGTTESFDALDLTGYDLKTPSDSPYSYTFNASGEYTFRYVAEPIPQSTLTVQYLLYGSGDPATELHTSDTYTQDVETSVTVDARSIEGYVLKSGEASSYTHTFGESGYTYTFWYVAQEQPTPQSTLTVYYKLEGSGTQLHSPSAYTRDVGAELTVDAYSISGYKLADDQDSSYTHTFGTSDDTYTFWYVERESPPPAAEYSTLTVYYRVAGSSPAVYLKSADTTTKKVGSSVTVDAPSFDGYILMDNEADSYTHTFTTSDATYTFWYEEEITVPEEEPPLAEPEETVEVPTEEPPLSELPATGGLPMELFYGFGGVLLAAGMLTGRKNRK